MSERGIVRAAVDAIQGGDAEGLRRLLRENPSLVGATSDGSRTLLHVVTDWPGHYPNGAAVVAALVEAGADVNARCSGGHRETPLHWAASSDDVEVLDALLDAGADIEAPGAVIGGGTPLADAVAFGHWKAARRLVERGAVANLWQAAALGLADRLEELLAAAPPPGRDEITQAFWLACHGGQPASAEQLLALGADLDWVGYDELTPLDAAQRTGADELVAWLRARGGRSAAEIGPTSSGAAG
jgi:uncharacterized protein